MTITQLTETRQVYSVQEVRAITAKRHDLGLRLHMDGARFSNAYANFGCSPADLTWRAGVELLCFGDTKNGMALGEAVLFFDPALAEVFDYRKQAGQLAFNARFLAAPWTRMLDGGAWLRNGANANAYARHFAARVVDLPGVRLAFTVEANGVFVHLPPALDVGMRERGWRFYTFAGGAVRFMFAWDAEAGEADDLRDFALRQDGGSAPC